MVEMSDEARRALSPVIQQGRPATWREKLGAWIGGRPLHLPGMYAEDVKRGEEAEAKGEDPLAKLRLMNRIFLTDHEKLDRVEDLDDLWDEVQRYAVTRAAVQQVLTAILGGELRFERGQHDEADAHLRFAEDVWRPSGQLRRNVASYAVDSYCRGFRLGEKVWRQIHGGEFDGLHMIDRVRGMSRSVYRLMEDTYGRPVGLELDVRAGPEPEPRPGFQPLFGSQWRKLWVVRGEADWERFLFMTSPEDHPNVAGEGAFVSAWPHVYFAKHVEQWMRSGAEKLGTVPVIAQYRPNIPPSDGPGAFPHTKDQVFGFLQEIQTHFRGVLPANWEVTFADTKAQGMAAFFETMLSHSRRQIELSIVLQTVSGGGEATGGTLGANVAILSGTFGGLVRTLQRRTAALIDELTEEMLLRNFGEDAARNAPTSEFENPDPEADRLKHERLVQGINLGLVDRWEPHLRERFDAPDLTPELIEQTAELRAKAEAAGLGQEQVSADAPLPLPTPPRADEVLSVIERVEDGDLRPRAALSLLSAIMPGADPDELQAMIQEAIAHGQQLEAEAVARGETETVAPDAADGGEADAEDVAQQALNGAQVTALQGIVDSVSARTLAPEAALLMIQTAFGPLVPLERARAMVDAAAQFEPETVPEGAEKAAQKVGQEVAASEPPLLDLAASRIRQGFDRLAPKVGLAYDASRPPPIRSDLYRGIRRTGLEKARAEAWAEEQTRLIGEWLSLELPECKTETDCADVVRRIADHYTDPDTLTEALSDG